MGILGKWTLVWAYRLVWTGAQPALEGLVRGDPNEELDARVARVQARMRDENLDALLLTTEANVRYLTGLHMPFWYSPTRPWFIVLPAAGQPIAVVPTIGEDTLARSRVGRVVTWPAPRPEDDGVSDLLAVLGGLPKASGRIGAELGPEMTVRMPIVDFERLKKGLAASGRVIVDDSKIMLRMRLVKSSLEVGKIHAACRAQSAAYLELPTVLKEGMTEIEACNRIKRVFLTHGVDDPTYIICRTGPLAYSDIIGHPTGRRLQRGDMMVVDAGCQVDGYFCDFNRNYAVGPPHQEVVDAYGKLYEATEAALRTMRPGARFVDLYKAMTSAMGVSAEGGVGRMGHSIGLQLTEWPSIRPNETTVLEAGMALSIEPSLAVASGGGRFVVTEEVAVVTETGYRLLTERAPTAIPEVLAFSSEL